MSHEHTAILQIAATLGVGGNLLHLSRSKSAPFTDADAIVGLSFEGFLFKDGKSGLAGCKGTLTKNGGDYMLLSIGSSAQPNSAIQLFYHAVTGEYRLESQGIPFDNIETIVVKLERENPKNRRVSDAADDGFDTTASAAQFRTNLDAKYGRRKEHLTAEGAMDQALESARSLVRLALECQQASTVESSSNTTEYWRSMTLMLNEIRETSIARSGESDVVLAHLWVLPIERIQKLRTPKGDGE